MTLDINIINRTGQISFYMPVVLARSFTCANDWAREKIVALNQGANSIEKQLKTLLFFVA